MATTEDWVQTEQFVIVIVDTKGSTVQLCVCDTLESAERNFKNLVEKGGDVSSIDYIKLLKRKTQIEEKCLKLTSRETIKATRKWLSLLSEEPTYK